MSFNVEGMTPEAKRYFDELEKISKLEVAVGFLAGQTYADGTSLPEVAAYNELGTSHSPARPFLKGSIENNQDRFKQCFEALNQKLLNGATAEQVLKELGEFSVGRVQEYIAEGNFAPNAPSTVKKKKSSHPLIDTGHMRQSVKYVVRGRGSTE